MTQLAGGILAERFGGKWVYGLAVLLSTTLGALSPVTARYNATLFMVLRAIQGASQGPAWPALYTISTKWFPHQERVRLFTFVGTGTPIGLIIGMQLSGLITDAVGWEAVFYTIAAGGAAWFIVYFFLLYSTPADHPRISKVSVMITLAMTFSLLNHIHRRKGPTSRQASLQSQLLTRSCFQT